MFWFHQLRTQNQNRKIEQKLWMASGNAGYNFGSCPDFLILQLFILAHTIYPSNRRNFSKSMGGGAAGEKCSRYHQNPDGTNFSSNLTFFPSNIGGSVPTSLGRALSNMGGGAGVHPKRYEITHLD